MSKPVVDALPASLSAWAKSQWVETWVPSFTHEGKGYRITNLFQPDVNCECPDFQYRRRDAFDICKHVAWARIELSALYQHARRMMVQVNEMRAVAPKRVEVDKNAVSYAASSSSSGSMD